MRLLIFSQWMIKWLIFILLSAEAVIVSSYFYYRFIVCWNICPSGSFTKILFTIALNLINIFGTLFFFAIFPYIFLYVLLTMLIYILDYKKKVMWVTSLTLPVPLIMSELSGYRSPLKHFLHEQFGLPEQSNVVIIYYLFLAILMFIGFLISFLHTRSKNQTPPSSIISVRRPANTAPVTYY